MKTKSMIGRIGTPWIIPAIVIFLITNFLGGCEFKENDYLLSSYYNQTHATYGDAKKYCNNINGQLDLVGIIMMMIALVSMIVWVFPDGPKNEQQRNGDVAH